MDSLFLIFAYIIASLSLLRITQKTAAHNANIAGGVASVS